MREFLARAHVEPALLVARQRGRPLARPADHRDHALARGHLDVEVGEHGIGGAPGWRGKSQRLLWLQARHERLIIVRRAGAAPLVMQPELGQLGRRPGKPLQAQVQGLDVGEDRRILLAGVLEVQRPLDGREVVVLDGHAAHTEPALGFVVGEHVLGPLLVELAAFALEWPNLQQFCRKLVTELEREGRLGAVAPHVQARGRQIGQPQHAPVGHGHSGLGPIGLIAGDAVARVANFEREFLRPAEVHRDGHRRRALAHQTRAKGLFAGHADGEHDAAACAAGLLVGVHARDRREGLARPAELHHDLAHRMAKQPALVLHLAHLQGPPTAAVLLHRIIIGNDQQDRRAWLGSLLPLELRRHKPPGLVLLVA